MPNAKITRRAIIKVASTTIAVLAAPNITTASPPHADAELFAALKHWQETAVALKLHSAAFVGDEPNGQELQDAFDAAVSNHDNVMMVAIEMPAKTLEGLRAKAKAISDSRFFEALGTDEYAKAAGSAMLADIVALHGPLPVQISFPRV